MARTALIIFAIFSFSDYNETLISIVPIVVNTSSEYRAEFCLTSDI